MDLRKKIKDMTLEEKASLLSGKDFWQTKDLPSHGIPSIFLADGPHGVRRQAAAADHLGLNESLKATCFPTLAAMANSWDKSLAEEVGTALGCEAAFQDVSVLLGPGLNMKRSPLCGRNFEYFSEDPYLAGFLAAGYVRGIQKSGVSACLKHFAANSQEERRMVVDSVVDERTLREIYLTGFEIAVKESNPRTVMSAYNPINGTYANENEHLLKEILRDEWGFDGVIVTDWGGNNDRVEALRCGNELEMPSSGGETDWDVIEAVRDGRLDESYVDEAVYRLLSLIFDAVKVKEDKKPQVDWELHHQTARRAAQNCIVLLKNNGVLPLSGGVKTALVGEFAKKPSYQGGGSSSVNPTKIDTALDCISDYDEVQFVGYRQGFYRYGRGSKRLEKQAVRLAECADVILVYLGDPNESEGLDRPEMTLPESQTKLLKKLKQTGKKIVAVMSCGAAVETDFTKYCDAVVQGYLGGQAGASGMLDVLTGRVNPSGKLAESYPIRYSDCPNAKYFPAKELTAEYREGPYIGYRYYDTARVDVKYPFGYGLSYTNFEYKDLIVTDNGVSFTLTNSGRMDGAEVAQLYVGTPQGKVFRPRKELKGFVKVNLMAGESKVVTIPFDEYTFRYFNVKTNKWEVEKCDYTIMIGASSADIKLEGSIYRLGTTDIMPYDMMQLPSYQSGNVSDVDDGQFRTLLGREIPENHYTFISRKRKRIAVGFNTTVSELKYARGWLGRFFAGILRFAYNFLTFIGKHDTANILMMGVFHMPLRGLSRMTCGKISWGQLRGLLMMFNGHFFSGLHKLSVEGRLKRKRRRLIKRHSKKGK